MLKNHFTALMLTLLLTCGTVFAATEQEMQNATDQAMAAMMNEPPMTQADIETFVNMMAEIDGVMGDENAIMKLYMDHNITPQRFSIVSTKITLGTVMNQGVTREQILTSGQVPEFMIPSDAEIELVSNNMDTLIKMMK